MIAFIIAGMLGPWQIVLIVVAFYCYYSADRKIPELMKGLGQGMKEFKNATKDNEKKTDKEIESKKPKNQKKNKKNYRYYNENAEFIYSAFLFL
jgi:sec-independent protein translocase protein TatA